MANSRHAPLLGRIWLFLVRSPSRIKVKAKPLLLDPSWYVSNRSIGQMRMSAIVKKETLKVQLDVERCCSPIITSWEGTLERSASSVRPVSLSVSVGCYFLSRSILWLGTLISRRTSLGSYSRFWDLGCMSRSEWLVSFCLTALRNARCVWIMNTRKLFN